MSMFSTVEAFGSLPTTITQTHTERNEASVDWTKVVHVLYLQLNYRIRKTLEIQDILD